MMLIIEKVISLLVLLLPILIAVAYLTLAERKIMGSIQQRKGPNFVGINGLAQPLADALKLMLKETVIPTSSNTFSFIFAPILTLFLSLVSWSVIPFCDRSFFVDINLGIMFLFASGSLMVYGVLLSGWSSNSRYAFYGSLRSIAQMISYEISIGLNLLVALACVGSLNLVEVVNFQTFIIFAIPLLPLALMFLVSILAETNRAPFDLPEAEAELVSGFNVEYASMGFALFFLAEYAAMILMSSLTTLVFLAGWLPNFENILIGTLLFGVKISMVLFFYIWVRSSFPRYRIDQLMRLCWKIFLPIVFGFVIFLISILFVSNGLY